MAKISQKVQHEAPNLQLDIWPLTGTNILAKFAAGEIDIIISPTQNLQSELPMAELYSEDFVVIAWDQNDDLGENLTREDYERLGHVLVRLGSYRISPIDEIFVTKMGVKRRGEIVVGAFDQAPDFVVKTKRIATIQRRLAKHFATTMPLWIFEVPFETPHLQVGMQWHPHDTTDPAHSWLRDSVKNLMADMP